MPKRVRSIPAPLVVGGSWEVAIAKALTKPRPAGGWPERPKSAAKPKKKPRAKR